MDVTVHWQFYGGGVYFNEAQCDSYNREEVTVIVLRKHLTISPTSLILCYNRYHMNVRGIKTISQDIPAWESVRIRCLFIVTGLSFFFSVFIFQILLLVTQVFCKK